MVTIETAHEGKIISKDTDEIVLFGNLRDVITVGNPDPHEWY
jgi:hypothetical protein